MKYKKYIILLLFISIAYIIFRHFNISLKFHSVENIRISQNPYEIITVKNKDNKDKIIKLITDCSLKNDGIYNGKGFTYAIEVDRHFIEVLDDRIIIDGFKYTSKDSCFMERMFKEFTRIYLEESKNK